MIRGAQETWRLTRDYWHQAHGKVARAHVGCKHGENIYRCRSSEVDNDDDVDLVVALDEG